MEESIMQNAPEEVKPLLCKHLYDNTYFLAVGSVNTISKDFFKKLFNVNVYIKYVSEKESNHVDVTFLRCLPEDMRRKYREYKNGLKGRI